MNFSYYKGLATVYSWGKKKKAVGKEIYKLPNANNEKKDKMRKGSI